MASADDNNASPAESGCRRRAILSLRMRFILGVAAMLLPLMLLGAGAFLSLRYMAASFDEALEDPAKEMHAIMHLQSQVLLAALVCHDYLIAGEPVERERFSRLRAEVERAFERSLAADTLWPEQRTLLESARVEWDRARAIAEPLLRIAAPVGNPVAGREMLRMDVHVDRAVAIFGRVHDLTQTELRETTERAHSLARWALLLIVGGIGVLGVFIATGSGFWLARFVLAPLRALEAAAGRFGAGELDQRVAVKTGDEFERLAGTFNAMAERLQKNRALLEELATHDPLTGAWNRRRFDELLVREMARARRYSQPLSLIMLDIDRFKNVNDTCGHQAGDDLLATLSAYVCANIRDTDLLARWGGEEFMLIAPGTSIETACPLAEKLRALIERGNFGEVGRITCSFGVTQFRADDTAEDFTGRADAAMYRAKQAGRNRVEC